MTPKFSEAVDPVFMHVLRLLERIDRQETPVAKEERQHIRGWIDQAEGILGQSPDWMLAKYALVAWIDEVLIEADWAGRTWWRENALEQEMFNSRLAFHHFWIKGKEASALPKKDALEVFYVCAVLGFRGLYRDPVEAVVEAEAYGLPTDLESWARQSSTAIRLGQGLPPMSDAGKHPGGAPALEGQAYFISYLLIGLILLAANMIMFAFFLRNVEW